MNNQLLTRAIGNKDGDYLELSNQWAKVFVTKQTDPRMWTVTGDILDVCGPPTRSFRTLSKAMNYAVESLAAYRDGSPNK